MLYKFLYPLTEYFGALNVFRYITFRTIYGGVTAFVLCLVFGPFIINVLKKMQIRQIIQTDGPKSHLSKEGTPTMGGVMILGSVILSLLFWGNLSNHYVLILLLTVVLFGAVGFLDDYLMLVRKKNMGLTARGKFGLQVLFGFIIGYLIYMCPDFDTTLTIPFMKGIHPDLGWVYVPFICLVMVATSNAVNLTDGLDGLVIAPYVVASVTYMLFAYVAGHTEFAQYLHVRHIPAAGEVTVLCGILAGAGMGFLWFNAHPAQVFMGDCGSLSLGAVLGAVAIVTKQEILLVLVGGLFVLEALSVIIQVLYFKWSKGKRIFKMAPLHHHFELTGWHESKVIVRFWIVSIILALIALGTLKIR